MDKYRGPWRPTPRPLSITSVPCKIERIHNRRVILQRSLTFAHDRFRAGYSSYIEELDAQRNLYNTELAAISVRESQLLNLVNLYRVLGGGWAQTEP